MRVLITGETLHGPTTGVQRATVAMANAIAARGDVELSVLVAHEEDGAALDARIRRVTHPVRITTGLLPWDSVPHSLLDAFDVVHCPTARVPFRGKPRARTVLTIHDLVPLAMPQAHRLTYHVYFRFVLPRAVRRFDAVIASSESTRADLQRFYGLASSAVTVVPLACHWERLAPSEVLRPKDPFFLWVGTLEPRKNLQRTVDAFEVYRKSTGSRDRLVVVGARGWGRKTRDIPEGVDILGYVDDSALRGLFLRARALVYPSLYEGFGFPVLEAMSLGCPVITSRRASLPEVGGDAVLYCDPLDPVAIAAAMQRIADESVRDSRIDAGLTRAADFSWDRTAARVVAVYRGARM